MNNITLTGLGIVTIMFIIFLSFMGYMAATRDGWSAMASEIAFMVVAVFAVIFLLSCWLAWKWSWGGWVLGAYLIFIIVANSIFVYEPNEFEKIVWMGWIFLAGGVLSVVGLVVKYHS